MLGVLRRQAREGEKVKLLQRRRKVRSLTWFIVQFAVVWRRSAKPQLSIISEIACSSSRGLPVPISRYPNLTPQMFPYAIYSA